MRKVLVTGAKGFIGRNLIARLAGMDDLEVFRYDLENDETDDEKVALGLERKNLEHRRTNKMMDRLIQDQEFRDMLKRKLEELNIARR